MDNPNLIRNVALVGHLHHGKVCADAVAAANYDDYDDDDDDDDDAVKVNVPYLL